jgi:HK97 family phage portal protein
MSIIRRAFSPSQEQKRAISFQTIFGTGRDVYGPQTTSGMPMSEDGAMKVTTAWACIRLLADTISTLPLDQMIRLDGQRRPFRPKAAWIDVPDPADPSFTMHSLVSQSMVSLLLDGNAFIHVTRDKAGEVLALTVLDPQRVRIESVGRTPIYKVSTSGKEYTLSIEECLHIPLVQLPGTLRGMSPIDQCREALGLTAAGEDFQSRYFGQGTSSTGLIEYPGDLTADQVQALSDHWKSTHTGRANAHAPAVLTGGAKFTPLSFTADQMQLLELRQFQRAEICAIYRVPSALVQDNQPGAVSYASVEQQALAFEKHTIRPYVQLIERHLSRLTTGSSFVKLNMEGLLRGDQKSRYEAFATGLNNGWLSVNEIRRWEDMRPVDNDAANKFRMPLNMGEQENASLAVLKSRVDIATQLVSAGYEPEQASQLAGLNIEHTGIPPSALQPLAMLDPEEPLDAYIREMQEGTEITEEETDALVSSD